jgi:hypothetical protein
LFVLPL